MIRLYRGDCLQKMAKIVREGVNLVVCDLPYGITRCEWDRPIDLKRLWEQYERVLAPNGAVLLFAQSKFMAALANSSPHFRYDLVWDKSYCTGFQNARRMPLRRHESILVFYRSLPAFHPQGLVPFEQRSVAHNKTLRSVRAIEGCRKGQVDDWFPAEYSSVPTRP